MLSWLVRVSLQYRVVVVVAAAALMIVGVYAAMHSPLDVFPEFAAPLVEVQVEAPGMSSEGVERLVTIPLESAFNGVPQMTVMRSKSVQGLSSVQMIFERGTDVFQARQMVTERLGVAAERLPKHQVEAPHVLPPLSSTSRIFKIGLKPKAPDQLEKGEPLLSQTDVSVLMKWVIEPRLYAVPGVANVSTYGLHHKNYQVLVRPSDLRDYGVTLQQVKDAVAEAAPYGSAGFHDTAGQRLPVHYQTRITSPADLGRTVVAHRKGQPVLLSQVATLTTGNPPHIGEGVVANRDAQGAISSEAGLLVVVEKYPWANTLEVTYNVEKAIEELRPALGGVDIRTHIFRPASFIETALDNLKVAMIIGCVLVALILLAFLFEWRTAAISLTAIPLSLITAVLVLDLINYVGAMFRLSWLGGTLNTMVLAGLAIAIGEVVDDAIIDVENIMRRLRQNRLSPAPRKPFWVVFHASLEVRSAVVYASLIVVFVCLPVFFLGGVAGAFFRPLAVAYILAVLASLGVALTVTPALCLMLLPQVAGKRHDPPLVRALRWAYRGILPVGLNRPVVALGVLALLLAGAVVFLFGVKVEPLPRFQENDFLMHWVAKPGTSIDVLREDIKQVGREMLAETDVKEFGSHIARAEVGEEVVGPNFSELWVSLGDYRGDHAAARKKIEAVMARHPGFEHDLLTYLQERIKEVQTGTGASIVLRIYGPDLARLRQKAQEVYRAIADIDADGDGQTDLPDLKVEAQVLVPQLELVVDPYRANAVGLRPRAIAESLKTLLNGTEVGEIHQDQKIFRLVVWGHPDIRKNWHNDLRNVEIDLPNGQGTVPLRSVADLRLVNAPNTIRHDKASRCIDVSCPNPRGDLRKTVQEIERRLKALPQEQGYHVEILGDYQAFQENVRQLIGVGVLALLGIAMLLYIDFRSFRLTLLVLITTLFALVGGVAAVYATGGVLSLGSLVGFVTVWGIAARNGIMMVSHYRHLQAEEGVPFGRELILQGAQERVAPILMTALAAGLGLLPLAISGNKPGYEVEYPMAVVILGGLAASTLLNLLVLPVLYEHFGNTALPDRTEEDEKLAALA
jgi:CzcA family heavy metal efflux pump